MPDLKINNVVGIFKETGSAKASGPSVFTDYLSGPSHKIIWAQRFKPTFTYLTLTLAKVSTLQFNQVTSKGTVSYQYICTITSSKFSQITLTEKWKKYKRIKQVVYMSQFLGNALSRFSLWFYILQKVILYVQYG